MKPSEYMASKELCKGQYYGHSNPLEWASSINCDSCCTVGAVVAGDIPAKNYLAVLEAVVGDIPLRWNDRPETTKEMALAALRETEKRLGFL